MVQSSGTSHRPTVAALGADASTLESIQHSARSRRHGFIDRCFDTWGILEPDLVGEITIKFNLKSSWPEDVEVHAMTSRHRGCISNWVKQIRWQVDEAQGVVLTFTLEPEQ